MRKITVTGMTNMYGNIVLISNDSNAKIVYCECNQCICVPFRYGVGFFGKILNVNSGTLSQYANAEVTIDVYYLH